MSLLSRRNLIRGVGALLTAPAIVRVASLMPVRSQLAIFDGYTSRFRWDLDEATRADIAELLTQANEMFKDMLWVEADLPLDRVNIRTRVPAGGWRTMAHG